MAKKKSVAREGKCLKEALLIIAKAGLPAPGSSEDQFTYVIRLNRKGGVDGVDVHLTEK